MQITQDEIDKLACKLIELFGHQRRPLHGFDRYWALAAPVETFLEHATDHFEQEVAKALHAALEDALRRTAPKSCSWDADPVAAYLHADPEPPRRYRARRPNIKRV